MDIKTLILALSLGNMLIGLALLIFQLRECPESRNRYWTAAKMLQSLGWLLLSGRGAVADLISFTAGNTVLLSGVAYEGWAMYRLVRGRTVPGRVQLAVVAFIAVVCVILTPFQSATRVAFASYVAAGLFGVSGWVLLASPGRKSPLRVMMGWSMSLVTVLVFLRGSFALGTREEFLLFSPNAIQQATFLSLYFLLLVNGFGMLLLSKEDSDRELFELTKEQNAILKTLPTGLCIVRDRVIEQCNPAMEAIFGFAPGTLKGQSVRRLFDSEERFDEYGQCMYGELELSGRYTGEVLYARQNGEPFWALDHARTIFPERSQFHAVFSVTDITDQKRQQETLNRQNEELEATLARTKRLEGFISICMHCKKIHTPGDSWEQLETYLSDNSDAHFSHGICPSCYDTHYPGYKKS